jgi:PAS domain S-box-containing protein
MSAGKGMPLDILISIIAAVGFGLTALYVAIARRHKPTWTAGVILLCACAEITMAHTLQRSSFDQETRVFWYKMVYMGFTVTPTAFLYLALRYSGLGHVLTNRTRLLLSIFPVLIGGLILTNEIHGLVWNPANTAYYATSREFLAAGDAGIWYWALITYSYLAMGVGCFFLIRLLIRSHRIYGWQTSIVIAAAVLAILGSMLDIFRVSPLLPFSTTELGLAVGSITVVYIISPLRRRDLLAVTHATVFNSISDAIIVLDGDKRIMNINQAAEKLVGRPASRALSRPLERLLPALTSILTREASTNGEVALYHGKTQSIYDLRLSVIQGWQGHIVGQVIVLHDIAERKQAERALKEYSERLEEMVAERTTELQTALQKAQLADHLKSEFIANVNHELRTPLTNLILYYQMLNAHPAEKTKERLGVIGRELQRLRALIENLLNLSRLDLGQATFNPRPRDLNQLIQNLVDDRRVLAEERNLTLKEELDPSLPAVWLDEAMIVQAVSNLLTNALNYTPKGGQVYMRTKIMDGQPDKPRVVFSIQDTGPGINEADLPHLFERFYRGKAGHETGTPGTGLGLVIVKQVVEKHHGRIEVENTADGHGAVFTVWLPVEQEREAG